MKEFREYSVYSEIKEVPEKKFESSVRSRCGLKCFRWKK